MGRVKIVTDEASPRFFAHLFSNSVNDMIAFIECTNFYNHI